MVEIKGLEKFAPKDFVGYISSTVFLGGCNFKCPHCYNPELARGTPAEVLEEHRVYDFLEQRKGLLDGVVISGGEPTLNKPLFSFCKKIKTFTV